MSQPETLSPDALASEIVADVPNRGPAPAAVPAATVAASPAPITTPAASGAPIMVGNVQFDPTKHKSNADGSPFINKAGRLMPIGGRRPGTASAPVAAAPAAPGGTAWTEADRQTASATPPAAEKPAGTPEPAPAPQSAPAAPESAGVDHCSGAAEVGARLVYLVLGFLFGAQDETTPDKSTHTNLKELTAAYIRSTGWRGTPKIGLAFGWLAYLIQTLQRPKPAAKVQTWFDGLWKARPSKTIEVQATEVRTVTPERSAAPTPSEAQSFAGFTERAGR